MNNLKNSWTLSFTQKGSLDFFLCSSHYRTPPFGSFSFKIFCLVQLRLCYSIRKKHFLVIMAQVIHQIWEQKVITVQISRSTVQVHFQRFKEPMDGVWICGVMLSVSSSTQPTLRTNQHG